MSGRGYQAQIGTFLLSIVPYARTLGRERMTWGRWTDALVGIQAYVEAYPGYDFSFEILVQPAVGASTGYLVGHGIGMTRAP